MAKEKNVTIVMPVGEDAGKKVNLPESNAKNIIATFGEWSGEASSAGNADLEIKNLKADLAEVAKARDAALAEVDTLKAELEELTNPAGGGNE